MQGSYSYLSTFRPSNNGDYDGEYISSDLTTCGHPVKVKMSSIFRSAGSLAYIRMNTRLVVAQALQVSFKEQLPPTLCHHRHGLLLTVLKKQEAMAHSLYWYRSYFAGSMRIKYFGNCVLQCSLLLGHFLEHCINQVMLEKKNSCPRFLFFIAVLNCGGKNIFYPRFLQTSHFIRSYKLQALHQIIWPFSFIQIK